MRDDGAFVFYRVQHKSLSNGDWCDSDLGHFYFHRLPIDQRDSARTREARQVFRLDRWLLHQMGENGFQNILDAVKALRFVADANPTRTFRLVRIVQTKATEQIALIDGIGDPR